MPLFYSVMWKRFVETGGEHPQAKLVTEVRSGLTEAAKDALVHELQQNGVMASVGRYTAKETEVTKARKDFSFAHGSESKQ